MDYPSGVQSSVVLKFFTVKICLSMIRLFAAFAVHQTVCKSMFATFDTFITGKLPTIPLKFRLNCNISLQITIDKNVLWDAEVCKRYTSCVFQIFVQKEDLISWMNLREALKWDRSVIQYSVQKSGLMRIQILHQDVAYVSSPQ